MLSFDLPEVFDYIEGHDYDFDGVPYVETSGNDTDGDGLDDSIEVTDGNPITDIYDHDNDNIRDCGDYDIDNDGIGC